MIRICAFADEAGSGPDKQIAALKRNEINLLELRSLNGVNVSDFTAEEAKEYNKRLKGEGIDVWSIGSPLGKVDVDTDMNIYIEKVKRVMETANIFGTDKVRVFSFFRAYDKKDKVIENLGKMTETAKSFGVRLFHENEKEIYGDVAERVLDLKAVDGLKFVYDPANFVQCGQDMKVAVETLSPQADYYHVKDVVSSTGEVVPSGYGDGMTKEMIESVCERDDKVFTIEPHLAVFDGYKDIDKTELKHKFAYRSNDEAFDAAVKAFKVQLAAAGYKNKGYNIWKK